MSLSLEHKIDQVHRMVKVECILSKYSQWVDLGEVRKYVGRSIAQDS